MGINDFLSWSQRGEHLTKPVPGWIPWIWSPETEFCCVAHYHHLCVFLLLAVPSPGCAPSHLRCIMPGGGEGRWEAVAVSVYAMPKINICGSGIILQQHLLFSPCFPFAFIFKIWAFSSCVCFKWEKTVCCKPTKWLFLKSRMSGESEASKQAN